MKFSVRDLCYIAVFAAIIAACAQVQVPQPSGVPFTLQAWAISLAGLILGPKKGATAALVYVLVGAVGAPVFAGFQGGIAIIMRPTGGFILSFPVVALLAGFGESKKGIAWPFIGLAAGSIFNWTVGLLWFYWMTEHSLAASFGFAVAPFLVVGVVRTAVLPFLSKAIKAAMKKAKLAI
jgi:biotin transport system substrate-specific component